MTAALVVSRQKSHMRTAINPITAKMVQIIFGHLLLSRCPALTLSRPSVPGVPRLHTCPGWRVSRGKHLLEQSMEEGHLLRRSLHKNAEGPFAYLDYLLRQRPGIGGLPPKLINQI